MKIIANKHGFLLFFDDRKDLAVVVEELKRFLENVKKNKVPKPYIYYTSDIKLIGEEKEEEIQKEINELKKGKI